MRKKFLIKPALQIRHLAWTMGVVLVSCTIGYFLFERMAFSLLHQNGFGAWDWVALKTSLRLGFVIILVILLVAIGIENYLLFHRFIGPIFVLERGLRKVAEGDLEDVTRIRESDQLSDLILAFEEMKTEVRAKLHAQDEAFEFLATEVDRLMASPSKENIKNLHEHFSDILNKSRKKSE